MVNSELQNIHAGTVLDLIKVPKHSLQQFLLQKTHSIGLRNLLLKVDEQMQHSLLILDFILFN
jgi:hypothetical protein